MSRAAVLVLLAIALNGCGAMLPDLNPVQFPDPPAAREENRDSSENR